MNKLYLTICFCSVAGALQAQHIAPSVYNTAGGQQTISGVTYEWSAGEMPLVSTEAQAGITITQGLLQPVAPTTGIKEILPEGLIQIFPNPATDYIFIQPKLSYSSRMTWSLSDAAGKIIRSNEVSLSKGDEQQEINIKQLTSGTYFLTIALSKNNTYQARTWIIAKTK